MNIDRTAMTAGNDGSAAASPGGVEANAGLAGIFAELLAAITEVGTGEKKEVGTGVKKDAMGDDASASAQVAMAGAFALPMSLVVPAPQPESDAGTNLSLADEAQLDGASACSAADAMQKMPVESAPAPAKLMISASGPAVAVLPIDTSPASAGEPAKVASPPVEPPPAATMPGGTPAPASAPGQSATAAPLTISFSPKVNLQAPSAAAPAAATRDAERGQPITGKPIAAAKSASSSVPTVTFERARASVDAAAEAKALRMPAPLVQNVPQESVDEAAPAPVELVGAAPPLSVAHAPVAHTPDKPLPTAPAAPAHPALQQVVQRVEKAIERGEDTITIELKPASLGHVEVQLRVAEDGRVAAAVTADRSDTLAVLQQDSARLEQALRDAGLRADAGSLSFSLREGNGQGDAHQRHGRGNRRNNSNSGTFAIDAPTNGGERTRAHVGALDLRI